MSRRQSIWPMLAALLLSGCLLPQPDTPIIPPRYGSDRMAAPAAPVQAPHAGSALAPDADAHEALTRAQAATVDVTVKGLAVASLSAVRVDDPAQVTVADRSQETYTLALTPGRYWLEVVVNGQALRLGQPIAVEGATARSLTLVLSQDPLRAVLEEAVPLAPPASPTPTPEAPAPRPS